MLVKIAAVVVVALAYSGFSNMSDDRFVFAMVMPVMAAIVFLGLRDSN